MKKHLLSLGVSRQPIADHEHCFVARYLMLRTCAHRVADGDRALGDDLLHDAFVQFVAARPDLERIEHLDAYLMALIRNLHVARLRRKANQQQLHISIEQYDSAALALDNARIADALTVRESLWQVRAYVCERKASSKAASVLVLRFFHGFYPTEIESILGAGARTVSSLLARARAEVRQRLDPPHGVAPLFDRVAVRASVRASDDPSSFLIELRRAIYATRQPPCPGETAIRHWYRTDAHASIPLDAATWSHVVSCRICLEQICGALDLPPLDERSPIDPPQRGSDEGGAGGNGGVGTGDAGRGSRTLTPLKRAQTRGLRDLREHHPHELQISVNGLPVGVLASTSSNRVKFTVRLDEPVVFAELHSEQNLRMLWLSVTPAAEGGVVQCARVDLTHGRSLEMSIDFSTIHPSVSVDYVDPLVSHEPGALTVEADGRHDERERTFDQDVHSSGGATNRRWKWRNWLFRRRGYPWFTPASAIALLTVALVGSNWWWRSRPAVPRAAVLLADAIAREAAHVLPATQIAHQTLRLEVRRSEASAGAVYRLERWTRGASAMQATRVFDDVGHVVAGQWVDADGQTKTVGLDALDSVWQASLSASVFQERFRPIGACTTAEDTASYTITCARQAAAVWLDALSPLLHAQTSADLSASSATLVLRRVDRHAIKLVVTTHVSGISRVVTLEEQSLRHVTVASVPGSVFAPDAPWHDPAVASPSPRTTIPTPSLEMRLIEIVDRAPERDHLTVDRATSGDLVVKGLVSDRSQRRALQDAVAALAADAVIAFEIQTFEEAEARGPGRRTVTIPRRVESLAPDAGAARIESYLLTVIPSGADVRALVRELGGRVLRETGRAREQAVGLRQIDERFSDTVMASLDQSGRLAWRTLVERRAGECLRALADLDQALAPYFPAAADTLPTGSTTWRSALHRLADSTATAERALVSAFTAGSSSAEATSEDVARDLRRHLARAAADARALHDLVQP